MSASAASILGSFFKSCPPVILLNHWNIKRYNDETSSVGYFTFCCDCLSEFNNLVHFSHTVHHWLKVPQLIYNISESDSNPKCITFSIKLVNHKNLQHRVEKQTEIHFFIEILGTFITVILKPSYSGEYFA